jgi:hypothetical protein
MTVFQGLTQYLQGGFVKFRKFVKEEHSVMGEADFPRLWITAAAYEGYL